MRDNATRPLVWGRPALNMTVCRSSCSVDCKSCGKLPDPAPSNIMCSPTHTRQLHDMRGQVRPASRRLLLTTSALPGRPAVGSGRRTRPMRRGRRHPHSHPLLLLGRNLPRRRQPGAGTAHTARTTQLIHTSYTRARVATQTRTDKPTSHRQRGSPLVETPQLPPAPVIIENRLMIPTRTAS